MALYLECVNPRYEAPGDVLDWYQMVLVIGSPQLASAPSQSFHVEVEGKNICRETLCKREMHHQHGRDRMLDDDAELC